MKWYGQRTILNLSDEEWLVAHEQSYKIGKEIRSSYSRKAKNELCRVRRDAARRKKHPVSCADCILSGTCEVKRKHHLNECPNGVSAVKLNNKRKEI